MNGTDDIHEINKSLKKTIQETKVTAEYIRKKIEEKQAEVDKHVARTHMIQKERNAETIKDLHQIQNDVAQLIEENELLKKQRGSSTSRSVLEPIDGGRSTVDLQAAESRNAQLSKRLARAEAELQALKMSQLRMESVAAAKTATQNASLMEKLYSAQKDRDKAVEEERLSTSKKLSQVEKQLQKERAKQNNKPVSVSNHNIEKLLPVLLGELAEATGAEQIKQKGQTLVDYVSEWKRVSSMNQQQQTGYLMGETKGLQQQQKVTSTGHQLKVLQDQLRDVITERDKALDQLQKLESDYEDLTILYSLQRHLTQESEIQHQYEQKVDQYKEQLDKAEQQISDITDELNRSIKERNVAIQSRNQLSQDLYTEQERSEKLERIVMVLRRKVQASSADSTPIHM